MLTQHNGKQWFFEELYIDNTFGFEVNEVLVSEYNTGFQKIMVVDTPRFGRVLILDNIVQFTEFDEFIYHESMVHTALFSHKKPESVLIIGGGDLCVAREVLKHSTVKTVTIVDIDPDVTEIVKTHFPQIASSVLNDSRLTLLHKDASHIDSLFKESSFDVILMDTTDDTSNAVFLFSKSFIDIIYKLLTNDGILVRLAGSFFLQHEEISKIAADTSEIFSERNVSIFQFTSVATYYGGPFALIIAGKRFIPILSTDKKSFNTKWYKSQLRCNNFLTIAQYNEIIDDFLLS